MIRFIKNDDGSYYVARMGINGGGYSVAMIAKNGVLIDEHAHIISHAEFTKIADFIWRTFSSEDMTT